MQQCQHIYPQRVLMQLQTRKQEPQIRASRQRQTRKEHRVIQHTSPQYIHLSRLFRHRPTQRYTHKWADNRLKQGCLRQRLSRRRRPNQHINISTSQHQGRKEPSPNGRIIQLTEPSQSASHQEFLSAKIKPGNSQRLQRLLQHQHDN